MPEEPAASAAEPEPASRTTLAHAEDWLQALRRLALSGPVKELAAHSVFIRDLGATVELALPDGFEHFRSEATVKRLADSLAQSLGGVLSLRFVPLPAQADGSETLFDRQQREKSEKQRQAEAAFENDPIVQRLLAQGATLVPGSIKPNEA
jgi:DNA polymerase III subunit gamma/tau